jgi:hypothetical protein
MPPKEQELSSATRQTWKILFRAKRTYRQQVAKPKRVATNDLAKRELYRISKDWPIENKRLESTILAAGDRISRLPARRTNNANTQHDTAPIRCRAGLTW